MPHDNSPIHILRRAADADRERCFQLRTIHRQAAIRSRSRFTGTAAVPQTCGHGRGEQKIYDTLPGRGQDGVLRGPLAFAAYNPGVAKALFDLHNAAVAGALDPHVRELAILVACRETNYSLEWNAHEPAALKAGVDRETIDVVRKNMALTGVDDRDAAVIRFGRQLFHDNRMDAATFAKAVQLFGKKGAMDLVAVMSTYAVSGFYATAVDEHMPAGRPDLERAARP
jgi:alkylhydroperoxidase family enzyme